MKLVNQIERNQRGKRGGTTRRERDQKGIESISTTKWVNQIARLPPVKEKTACTRMQANEHALLKAAVDTTTVLPSLAAIAAVPVLVGAESLLLAAVARMDPVGTTKHRLGQLTQVPVAAEWMVRNAQDNVLDPGRLETK